MSSLLTLQNKDRIIMVSDTAASILKEGKKIRVSDSESKIFHLNNKTIFASGNKLIRDVFKASLEENDSIESIEYKLKNYILPSCSEFSLGVVISEVFENHSEVTSMSSYNGFNREVSISRTDETKFFSAGIKTKELYEEFESNLLRTGNLIESIKKSYHNLASQDLGGFIDVYQISKENIKEAQFKVDDISPSKIGDNDYYVSLIWGEYIFGKVISGVNLLIEDESGVWKTQGARTTIYDRTGKETMWLGLVSDNARDQFDNLIPQGQECFGLVSWNDHTRVEVTTCTGIAISRWRDDNWQRVFWANTDGTLYTKHIVAEGIKIVNDNGSLMLDAENNFFNIGLFENIVADGKLTTLEKLQIVVELNSIHADYKATLAHADKYIRSSRDNVTDTEGAWNPSTGSFPTTNSTIDRFDKQPLINAYTALMDYISQFIPITNKGIQVGQDLLIDINGSLMEETSEIENRGYFIQVFRDYNDESLRLKQAIEDSVFYSGINLGSYYNNLVMNEFGFIAVRNDGKYRAYLNATNGLALQKWENNAWVSKLFATLGDPMWEDGTLYAEGLVTHNLRIVRANMKDAIIFDWEDGITIYGNSNQIKLNANKSIEISDYDGDRKFWVNTQGKLFAKDITTHNLQIVDGNLGQKIEFDQNDGITINGNNGEQIRLNANEGIAVDVAGDRRIWIGTDGLMYAKKLYILGEDQDGVIEDIDGSYISDLTVNSLKTLSRSPAQQNIVHIAENFIKLKTTQGTSELTKLEFTYEGSGATAYPVMKLGSPENGIGTFGSGSEVAKIYKDSNRFAIEYDAPTNKISRFYFNDTDTDDEGQAVYFDSQGGIRFNSDNKFVAKTTGTQYIRLVKDQDVRMQFNENKAIVMEQDRIRIQFDVNNYIEMTAEGIKMIAPRIDLN